MRSPRRAITHRRTGMLAVAVSVLVVLPASAALARDLLPDLVPTAPTSPQETVTRLADGQNHFLIRFDGYLHNIGEGPVEIRGSNPVNGVMTVTGQRIYTDNSGFRDDNSRHPVVQFETADGHNHWHFKNAARYSLWNETGTAEVARGAKVGFCLEDVDRVDSFGVSDAYSSNATQHCGEGQPNASSVFQGISRGWQDFYRPTLPFQWVDLSDVAPGRYRLGAQVDPDNFVLESNESNNGPALASDIVTVPGWLAASGTVTVRQAQTIVLGAQQLGSPGQPVFKIESAPKHGKLSPLTGFQIVYTPNPGFAGSDTFTFSARDSSSSFPLHSPVGVVTVKVPRQSLQSLTKLRLLTKVRFLRRGRFLILRARAKKTGMLRVQIQKGKRQLGSCKNHARSRHGFRCRIKLRKHASARGAKVVVSLLVNGQPAAVELFRVPRRLKHA